MSDSDDKPEVIRAKSEAEARVLEARSKLHPAAQFLYTFFEQIQSLIGQIGCLLIIVLVIVAIFAPQIITHFFGGG